MSDQDPDSVKKAKYKTLIIDGTKYKTNFNKKFEEKEKYVPSNSKLLTAFIPGTILKIYVKEGQKVKTGTKLLTLEAMKMKNRIIAPFGATVKKINVTEGKIVSKNEVLIELE